MATFAQRYQAIGDAIVNKVATTLQLDHLGRALAWRAGMLTEYEELGLGGKAQFAVEQIRRLLIQIVKHYDEYEAAETARAAAVTAVDNEFSEGV